MKIWQYYLKSLKRTRNDFCLLFLYFLCGIGLMFFFIINKYPKYLILYFFARYNFYFCFLISGLTYFILSKANRNFCKEVIEASKGKNYYEKIGLYLIFFFILTWNILISVFLLFYNISTPGWTIFLPYYLNNYSWNILFPQILCSLVIYILLLLFSRRTAFVIDILFLFLISPFSEKILWKQKPSIPIDYLYNIIRHPFEILYQNSEWAPNLQTNLQTERIRKELFVFWFLFFIGIIIFIEYQKRKSGYFLMILAFICIIFTYRPASTYRLNQQWNGIEKDFSDYERFEKDNYLKPLKNINYTVTSYNLDVILEDEMTIQGYLSIKSDIPQNQFTLTLHKNYKIKEIKNTMTAKTISYTRQEDFIYLKTEHPTAQLDIQIIYSGHHPQFYANRQEAMLPGWFPWYPMAGEKQIFLEYSSGMGGYGYNPYTRIEPSDITLNIISDNKNLVTNLEPKGGTFKGKSDSITLLMGNIKKVEHTTLKNYLPLEIIEKTAEAEYCNKIENTFQNTLNILETVYGIDTTPLQEKKIILMSEDLGRTCNNNTFAIFDDYILASSNYLDSYTIINYLICKNTNQNYLWQNSFLTHYFIPGSDSAQDVINDMKFSLEQDATLNTDNKAFLTNIQKAQNDLKNCIESSSTADFIKRLTQYVLGNTNYKNEQEFINSFSQNKDGAL